MSRWWVVVLWLGIVGAVYAEDIDTSIQQTIVDATAPTVPSDVTGVPVSLSSLQLSWTASTDNVAVSGYHIWREGIQIATTTNTAYTDVGLASSTAYDYYLTAFDAAGNESASSSVVTVSTVGAATASTASRGTSLLRGVLIEDVRIHTASSSVAVQFVTDRYVYSRVTVTDSAGASQTLLSDALAQQHTVTLTNLTPAMTYDVFIEVFFDDRFVMDTYTTQVRTDAVRDTDAPPNVSALRAQSVPAGVALSWVNPDTNDFDRVRIVRSTRWFPQDLVDGWVVYEGDATQFVDRFADRPVYYTVFSMDAADNRSSGAVVAVWPTEDTVDTSPSAIATEPASTALPPSITEILPRHQPVYIVQADAISSLHTSDPVTVVASTPFTLRIPAAGLHGTVNTVVGTLVHPQAAEGVFHFLLQRSTDGDHYEATLGSLPQPGEYELTVQWIDFTAATAGRTDGSIFVAGTPVSDHSNDAANTRWWFGVVLFVLGLMIIYRRIV